MIKNRQKIVKKGENRQNTILRKISFKIRFSIKSMKLASVEQILLALKSSPLIKPLVQAGG